MTLRDRRGPLTALVLAAAYALVLVEGLLALATVLGWQARLAPDPVLQAMLAVSLAGLLWRTAVRACFTAHEYGVAKGRGRCCAFPSPTSSRSLPGARR